MSAQRVDLADVFRSVTQTLQDNQQALDQSDSYNHDHGTNMVQTFQTITNALEKKQGASDSAALSYAARMVARNSTSSSSQLYAQNLNRAAQQFRRKAVDEQGAMQLLQTLIGATQQAQPPQQAAYQSPQSGQGGDLLGALLGGMMGGGASAPSTSSSAPASDDMLGMLLGGLTGGSSQKPTQSGVNLQNLVAAGMAFMQARQSGADNMQALIQAFTSMNGMGSADHRQQSTQLVIQAFLQALGAMGSRR